MTVRSYTDVAEVIASLNAEFDAREAYEASKSSKASMFAKLKNQREYLTHNVIASKIAEFKIDVALINRHDRRNARMNVYSIDKFVTIMRCAAKVESVNHYVRAIMLTARSFQQASHFITQSDAMLACNFDVKHKSRELEKLIVRYEKVVDASTASTQASAALNILKECNVLREFKNASNDVCFELDLSADLVKQVFAYLNV